MSRTIAVHVRYKSLYISQLPSSAKQQQQQQQQHLYSPSTHADKVQKKKINNISVCTQLSLELK